MKKLFLLALMALMTAGAFAQGGKHVIEDDDFDLEEAYNGYMSVFYNHNLGKPDGMSPSGWGLDFNIIDLRWAPGKGHSVLSASLCDLSWDINYLQRGHLFDYQGEKAIIKPADANMTKISARLVDFGLTFPLGYTYEGDKWALGVYVAPGMSFASFDNSYIQNGWQRTDNFRRDEARISFRLDVKAALWINDFGVMLRYRPLPALREDLFPAYNVISAGISFRM
jgi:hypothetical protein